MKKDGMPALLVSEVFSLESDSPSSDPYNRPTLGQKLSLVFSGDTVHAVVSLLEVVYKLLVLTKTWQTQILLEFKRH